MAGGSRAGRDASHFAPGELEHRLARSGARLRRAAVDPALQRAAMVCGSGDRPRRGMSLKPQSTEQH
jgi:hypothetical protein